MVSAVAPDLVFFVHGVKQIEVHMIGFQLGQLFVQKPLHIRFGFQQPERQLGGQGDAVAVAVLKRKPDDGLAFAVVIGISRVHIRYAVIDGVTQHGDGLRTVDDPLSAVFDGRKAHAAEAEPGDSSVSVGERSVLHGRFLLS